MPVLVATVEDISRNSPLKAAVYTAVYKGYTVAAAKPKVDAEGNPKPPSQNIIVQLIIEDGSPEGRPFKPLYFNSKMRTMMIPFHKVMTGIPQEEGKDYPMDTDLWKAGTKFKVRLSFGPYSYEKDGSTVSGVGNEIEEYLPLAYSDDAPFLS